jgi:5-methylthioadenosine/S-adenosylhomocysteine deaminase
VQKHAASTLIWGGRVYDHDADTDQPAHADLLIVGERIAAVEAGIAERLRRGETHPALAGRRVDRWIDARDRMVMPGFISAHYHSHDVLLRGSFEAMPLDYWLMTATPPSYPPRSLEELRVRTLVGALDALRHGITTVQDMATIFPYSDEAVRTVIDAYADIGIRCIFAMQVVDITSLDTLPFWSECVPKELHKGVKVTVEPFANVDLCQLLEDVYKAHGKRHPLVTWSLGPSTPERCTHGLLEGMAELSRRHGMPIYTHIYENKAMALAARWKLKKYGGSLVDYLEATGVAGPHVSLAHSVWLLESEIDKLAASGTNVVLCPASNMKSKSGVAPMREFVDRGVNVAIGTDNCACSDTPNMFHSMKLFVGLAAVSKLEPGPPYAKDAIRAATVGSARTAGMEKDLGSLKPGMKADLFLLDLNDSSYLPFNSAARQVVYSEAGRGVKLVMVDGRVIIEDGKVTTIDEGALREAVAGVMPTLLRDRAKVLEQAGKIYPYILEADRRVWASDVGTNRYIGSGL